MNEIKIKELIRYGESTTLEFKEAGGNSLPSGLFDTICAFLNTEGGIILLGVKDNGEISGVNPDCTAKLKNDLANLANKGLLQKAHLSGKDHFTGKTGYTLAAILLFGSDDLIETVLPAFKFDALLRKDNVDRYDDRLLLRTNIIDAYDQLMGFIEKHLNDPFHLEGDIRISLREKIFRELVSNIIAHREYADARPATIMIYKDRVEFKNPNHPNGKGPINPNSFVPRPKNPVISKFMIQLGRAEELGSGITNVTKYLPFYSKGAKAVFIEDSMFTTVIPLVPAVKETPGETPGEILSLLKENPHLTIPELAGKIGKSESAVERAVRKLRESKRLKHIGPNKGGHWKVIEK